MERERERGRDGGGGGGGSVLLWKEAEIKGVHARGRGGEGARKEENVL